jgi:hypothetical protein
VGLDETLGPFSASDTIIELALAGPQPDPLVYCIDDASWNGTAQCKPPGRGHALRVRGIHSYVSDDSSLGTYSLRHTVLEIRGIPTTCKIDESLIYHYPVSVLPWSGLRHATLSHYRYLHLLDDYTRKLTANLSPQSTNTWVCGIMGLPWEIITATSAISTLTLAWAHNDWSKPQLLGRFPVLWVAGFAIWVVWAVWIYPLLVSPLRHLPGPSGNHWLMGQSKKIMAEPSGVPMRQWLVDVYLKFCPVI